MNKRTNDILDDEFRVIGRPTDSPGSNGHGKVILITIAAVIAIVAVGLFIFKGLRSEPTEDVFDTSTIVEPVQEEVEAPAFLGDYSDTTRSFTEFLQQTVNDIPLSIYIPHNATAELALGTPDAKDTSIIFAAQAADIRADNGKISGAFVLAGEPLTWGLSKKGYVSILDGQITVGVADNSPLFEKATETGGYFFRQYPLVDNGVLTENVPKGKAVRKAICDRHGEIMIIFTETPESFHDFSQALIDMGVTNAVYLVGSEYSYGFCRDKEGLFTAFAERPWSRKKYENYIVWKEASSVTK